MVIHLQDTTANNLFIRLANELLNNGQMTSPRGKTTIELEDVFLTLTDLDRSIVTLESRATDFDYLNGEFDWYSHGSYNADEIIQHSKFWSTITNEDGTVNSNYGQIALRDLYHGQSQFDWCKNSLLQDESSRQCVINYNQPKHKYQGNKDYVCTIAQTFMVRNKKLDSRVFMRSNDMIFGLTYDLPWFVHIQKKLANEVGIETGVYHHYAQSMHVYSRHFDMLDKISKEKLE